MQCVGHTGPEEVNFDSQESRDRAKERRRMNHKESVRLHQKALSVIPGGVNSPVRSFRGVGGSYPIFIQRAHGSHIWDVDGNKYLDLVGSWGPLILGHAHPLIIKVIEETAREGTSFGASTDREIDLATLIVDAFPSIEMVRLVNSGTEATMSAIRLARAYTHRSKIVKFTGCYHGHSDALLVDAGSGLATAGIPSSAGVPESLAQDTLVAEYNYLPSAERLFEVYPKEIAAIIVEPVAGNMGVVPPMSGFLDGLQRLAKDHDTLLILDEVITGFRIAYGGAQERYGIRADITCLGKVIGGGLPVGAYGARRDIMEQVAPLGPMYQAGTLSGNPLAVAAGLETLKALQQPGVYDRLEQLGLFLEKELLSAAQEVDTPLTVNRVGSMLTAFFHPGPVAGWDAVTESDTQRYARFFYYMLELGIYLAPSSFESAFISLAHTEQQLAEVGRIAKAFFAELS